MFIKGGNEGMRRDDGCVGMYKENWWEGGFYGLSFLLDLLESCFTFFLYLRSFFTVEDHRREHIACAGSE